MKKIVRVPAILSGVFICMALALADVPDEMIIGEAVMPPGIRFIFEGAIKDDVVPAGLHLAESATDIHIEARVFWDTEDGAEVPRGAVPGGFVPYLYITATVTNEETGVKTFVDLLPHLNLVDNFHYARNIPLPGKGDDLYTVRFDVGGASPKELALHKDWRDEHGDSLTGEQSFTYRNQDFAAIAAATRR